MRRALALLVPVALALAGCGQDGAPAGGDGLGYVPRDTPLVAVVSTDLDSDDWRALDGRVVRPNADAGIEELLRGFVEDTPLSWEDDVEPLLGGDLVVGQVEGTPLPGERDASSVLALDTGDGDRLRRVLGKLAVRRVGEHRGAALYGEDADDVWAAVDGDVLLLSFDGAPIRAAIDRQRDGAGLTPERVEETLGDLPEGGLARLWGHAGRLLAEGDARALRSVPWIGALRDYGATVSVDDGGVRAEAIARTEPEALSDEDLPIAPGEHRLSVPDRDGELLGASHDQSRTTRLLWRAVLAAYPDSRFARDVRTVERALEIDFERDVLAQFARPSASALAPDGRFGARSELADPDRMRELLPRLAPEVGPLVADLQALRDEGLIALLLVAPDAPIAPRVLERSSVEVERLPGPDLLYRVSGLEQTEGELSVELPQALVFGMVGDVFVVASDAERARAVADGPLRPLEDVAAGTATSADLSRMRAAVARALGLDRSPFGELVAYVRATREHLRGTLRADFE